MNYKLALLIALFLVPGISFSQDYIVKKNGDEIKAKVVEVGVSEIKYRKFESPEGPIYVITKSDVFMVKYQDGNKDVFGAEETTNKTEVKAEPEKKEIKEKQATESVSTGNSYLDKVREIQKNDPNVGVYFGNGFLNGPGYSNPVLGFDLRLSRKNVFLGGLHVGFRAGFKNAVFYGDYYAYKEIYGFSVAAKYYAPVPIKFIQPYVITHLGLALENTYVYSGLTDSGYYMHDVYDRIAPFIGFGIGSNFMVAKRFGFFVEGGYFTATLINLGLIVKF